jgi:L-ascorbate metabolism protein UlaG (beta-lactamase superfamily)
MSFSIVPPDTQLLPEALTIRRVGWAGYEITTENGTRVVIDPYLRGGEGFHQGLPESPVTIGELADADIVAVTHAGFDHRGQALEIVGAGDALLASGPALFREAQLRGIPVDRCALLVSGVELRWRDIVLKALDARHDSTMSSGGQFISDQPMSFLVTTAGGSRIFCGGDFSLSADLKTWRELYAPEVAVLGIGGIRVGAADITELPPPEAAIAASWLGVSTVIPVHYLPGHPAPEELAAELARLSSPIRVAPLEFGQTWHQAGT